MNRKRTAHQKGNRNTVVEDIRQMMAANYVGKDLSAACLFWAKATCIRLREAGHRAVIQAGTAAWRRIPDELDDGVVDTHYGYQWDVNEPANQIALMEGRLPELHCWAAIPDRNQIIDLTTGFQVEQCERTTGLDWPANHPPDWLWVDCEKMDEDLSVYHPCRFAIELALNLLEVSKWGE